MISDRSLEDRTFYYKVKKKSHLIALNRLVDRGFLKNNREMFVSLCRRSVPRLFRIIRSMTHLEKLSLLECQLTLTEDVPQLFRSCPTLTELHVRIVKSQKSRMNKVLKNQLRKGFERLRLLELDWYINSCPAIQEIFT
jgi:hypothetical protein